MNIRRCLLTHGFSRQSSANPNPNRRPTPNGSPPRPPPSWRRGGAKRQAVALDLELVRADVARLPFPSASLPTGAPRGFFLEHRRRQETLTARRGETPRAPCPPSAVHAGAAIHCWPAPTLAMAEIARVLRPDRGAPKGQGAMAGIKIPT